MIITKKDIDEFEKQYINMANNYFESIDNNYKYWISGQESKYNIFIKWLLNNPQIIVASGFQEYLNVGTNIDKDTTGFKAVKEQMYIDGLEFIHHEPIKHIFRNVLSFQATFRSYEGQWSLLNFVKPNYDEKWQGYSFELINKLAKMDVLDKPEVLNDVYQMYKIICDNIGTIADRFGLCEKLKNTEKCNCIPSGFHFDIIPKEYIIEYPSAKEIIERASKLIDNPLIDQTCFVSPKIWTPEYQWRQKEYLQKSTVQIMQELINNNKELKSINWRELEEIVAEILRSKGMQISINKENPQGGRDIIARGVLVPGTELITIAIEVKHKDVVDRPEVQTALYQNRMFPALMFVTSGRFTSGVIQEAMKPDNKMRLFLKDGVAIRELLHSYRFA